MNLKKNIDGKNTRKNKRILMALRAVKATGSPTFTSTEIGKRINESARTTSHFLALTTGVVLQGFGVYEFTGEPIEVQA
jgi:hypothetical protein